MLILGAHNLLLHVHHQKLGKHDISQLPFIMKEVSALTYNSLDNLLLVNDNKTRMIMSFNFTDGITKPVQVGELGYVTSMDFGIYDHH